MGKGWNRFDERGLNEILYAPSAYSAERKRKEQYVYELLSSKSIPGPDTGKKKTHRHRTVVAVLLVVAMIATAALYFLIHAPGFVSQSAAGTAEELAAGKTTQPVQTQITDETVTGRKDWCYTVLAVGRDASGVNTDAILVGYYDKKEKILNIVSIPRDTLVNVRWNVKKINSVYSQEGADGLMDELSGLFGYRLDQSAIVSMGAFETLIDELGGVWFNVPVDMDYDDPSQGLSIHYTAGYQLLTGHDAMCIFRFRQNSDGTGYLRGDLDRIDTQQALLSALVGQALSPETLFNLKDITATITRNVDTTLTTSNILWYGGQLLSMDKQNIRFYTMPVCDATLGNLSYVYPDVDAWVQMLNDSFNPFTEPITQKDLSILYQNDDGTLCMTDGSTPYKNFY